MFEHVAHRRDLVRSVSGWDRAVADLHALAAGLILESDRLVRPRVTDSHCHVFVLHDDSAVTHQDDLEVTHRARRVPYRELPLDDELVPRSKTRIINADGLEEHTLVGLKVATAGQVGPERRNHTVGRAVGVPTTTVVYTHAACSCLTVLGCGSDLPVAWHRLRRTVVKLRLAEGQHTVGADSNRGLDVPKPVEFERQIEVEPSVVCVLLPFRDLGASAVCDDINPVVFGVCGYGALHAFALTHLVCTTGV